MALVERVQNDPDLRARFASVSNEEGLLALLAEFGVQATIDDVKHTIAELPLSEEELAGVAGGNGDWFGDFSEYDFL